MKEIVIKIPDEVYERVLKPNESMDYITTMNVRYAIRNFTELPKGHDKLIAEPTDEEIAKTIGGNNEFADCIREAVKAVFDNADAVVEADKGEEE